MPSDLFMQAVELFQQGQPIEAETLLIAGVGKSKETHGTGSAEFAQANYELGSLN